MTPPAQTHQVCAALSAKPVVAVVMHFKPLSIPAYLALVACSPFSAICAALPGWRFDILEVGYITSKHRLDEFDKTDRQRVAALAQLAVGGFAGEAVEALHKSITSRYLLERLLVNQRRYVFAI